MNTIAAIEQAITNATSRRDAILATAHLQPTWERRHNAHSDAATEAQRIHWLTDDLASARTADAQAAADTRAVETLANRIGNPTVAILLYIACGPTVLPVADAQTAGLYEVRILERRGGYTVPGTVRDRVPAAQVKAVEAELMADVLRPGGHAARWGMTRHDFHPQAIAS